MPTPGEHWSCGHGRTGGAALQAVRGVVTFSPCFWVAGSCNGQPLTTGSSASGQCNSLLSKRGVEESNST